MNARYRIGTMILMVSGYFASAQAQSSDSVVIRVGRESKVTFLIKDKRDLETLKHYNFQALMDEMVQKLEKRDTSALTKPSREYRKDSTQATPPLQLVEQDHDWDENQTSHRNRKRCVSRRIGST